MVTNYIEGVRSYLESELTEDMLKPKENVRQEEREEVSKHDKKFFNGVPEFTELWGENCRQLFSPQDPF